MSIHFTFLLVYSSRCFLCGHGVHLILHPLLCSDINSAANTVFTTSLLVADSVKTSRVQKMLQNESREFRKKIIL